MEQSGSGVDVVLVLLQVRAAKLFTRDVIFYKQTNSKSNMVKLKMFLVSKNVNYPKYVNVQWIPIAKLIILKEKECS